MKYEGSFWDQRFSSEEYIYGEEPNEFFRDQLLHLPPGTILLPGEGEGRNAVFAAKTGWKVKAFDFSRQARKKALKLAEKHNVSVDYSISELSALKLKRESYDAAGLIFVHLHFSVRDSFHRKISDSLKPGGRVILEAFNKNQLGKSTGGPQNPEMLYSVDDIRNGFSDLKTLLLREEDINLNEGIHHSGIASVIRYVGEKRLQ
ncbi:MAG: class I SAM-dependent methyltransferase [Ignavibacteriaceae bacterium]